MIKTPMQAYILVALAVVLLLAAVSVIDVRGIYYPMVPIYIPLTPN